MSPARMTTDQLPAKLKKREIEVLAALLFTAGERFDGRRGGGRAWRNTSAKTQAHYRRLARLALTHVLQTHT